MKKYICTGTCEGESDKPGVCQDKTCDKYGQPLVEVEVPEEESSEQKEEKSA